MSDKVIVTAAVTGGIHTPSMSPHLPITPRQIADEVVRSYEAGASVAHIHVRDPETGRPSHDLDLFHQVVTEIKSRCNIILCLTTGARLGMTPQERIAVIPRFKPELGSLNAGSLNFGLFQILSKGGKYKFEWEKQFLAMTEDFVWANTFKTLREFCKIFRKHGTKPELEIYDLGMIHNVAYLIQQGYLQPPVHVQFVFGILGGAPAVVENLEFFVRTARGALGDLTWSVCAAGRFQMMMCIQALLMGGNVRVGLEDNLYVDRGVMAKSNAEPVAKIVHIARELGREPATPDEARQILGLKSMDGASCSDPV